MVGGRRGTRGNRHDGPGTDELHPARVIIHHSTPVPHAVPHNQEIFGEAHVSVAACIRGRKQHFDEMCGG